MSRVQQICLMMLAGAMLSTTGCANSRQRLAAVFGGRAGGDSDFSIGEITDYRDKDVIEKAIQSADAAKDKTTSTAESVAATADEKLKSLKTRSKSMTKELMDPADALIAKAKSRGLDALKQTKSSFPDDPFNNDYDSVIAATDRSTNDMIAAAKNRGRNAIQQTRAQANAAVHRVTPSGGPMDARPSALSRQGLDIAEPLLAQTPAYRGNTDRESISLPKNYNRYSDSRDPRGYESDPRDRRYNSDSNYDRQPPRRSDEYAYDAERSRDHGYGHEADRDRDYDERGYDERRYESRRPANRYGDRDQYEAEYASDERGDYNNQRREYDDRYRDERYTDKRYTDKRYADERGSDSYDNRSRSRYADDPRYEDRHRVPTRTVSSRSRSTQPDEDDDPLRPSKIFYPDAEEAKPKPESQRKTRTANRATDDYAPRQRDYDSRPDPRDRRSDYDKRSRYDNRSTRSRDNGRVTDFDQLFDDLERKRSQQRSKTSGRRPVRRRFDDDFEADDGRDPKQYESIPGRSGSGRYDLGPTAAANKPKTDVVADADERQAKDSQEEPVFDEPVEFASSETATEDATDEEKQMAQDLVHEFEEAAAAANLAKADVEPKPEEPTAARETSVESVASTETQEENPFPDFAAIETEQPAAPAEKPAATFVSQPKPAPARVVANANANSLSVDEPDNPFAGPFDASAESVATNQQEDNGNPFSSSPNESVAAHDVAPNRLPGFAIPGEQPPLPSIHPGKIQQTSLIGADPVFDEDPVFAGRTPQSTLENVAMEVKPDFDALTTRESPPQKQWLAMAVVGICSIFLVYLLRPTSSRV